MTRAAVASVLLFGAVASADEPVRATHQVFGLFAPDRVADLKVAAEELPGVKVIEVNFELAEATFEYDQKAVFGAAKPDQLVKLFDSRLRTVSQSTFGIKPGRSLPADKLERVEIAVAGLDCKACSFAAYEIVAKLDGVERATASFREGRVTAMIDPAKTDRAKLEDALKKRNVVVKPR